MKKKLCLVFGALISMVFPSFVCGMLSVVFSPWSALFTFLFLLSIVVGGTLIAYGFSLKENHSWSITNSKGILIPTREEGKE